MKEKLQEYALIAEIFSAVAIVISLIFVGLQIQQNSRVSEVTAFQDLTSQLIEFSLLIAEDETIQSAFSKGATGAALNQRETTKVRMVFTSMVRHGELAFLQYKNGFITESQLRSTLLPLTTGWSDPNMQSVFEIISGFNEEYREYLLATLGNQ